MNEQSKILVVSSVPTLGYMIVNGLIQIAIFAVCLFLAYYLLTKAGLDILSILRGEGEEDGNENNGSERKSEAQPQRQTFDKQDPDSNS